MALDTYTNLKTAIGTWFNHGVITANVDDVIDLTEAWFNRNLRVRQMETVTTSLTITAGVVTHPTGWLAWKNFKTTTPPIQHMEIYTEETIDLDHESGTAGTPARLLVRGDASYLSPVPSTAPAHSAVYYTALLALSGSQATNWLLTAYPDAYLYGCLMHGAMLLQDDQAAMRYQSAFKPIVDEIMAGSRKDTRSGGSLAPRVRRVV